MRLPTKSASRAVVLFFFYDLGNTACSVLKSHPWSQSLVTFLLPVCLLPAHSSQLHLRVAPDLTAAGVTCKLALPQTHTHWWAPHPQAALGTLGWAQLGKPAYFPVLSLGAGAPVFSPRGTDPRIINSAAY